MAWPQEFTKLGKVRVNETASGTPAYSLSPVILCSMEMSYQRKNVSKAESSFLPPRSSARKKEDGVPGGNLVLELVYQQHHLAHLQPLVQVGNLSFQTPGLAGGRGSQPATGPAVIENPRSGVWIASEL